MATIATLVVKVLGDASDLKSNMASATQDMKKQADAMKSFGASLTAGVTLPILGLGAAAIKGAADQEQLQVAFTTMLGSADKATNLIKQLQQFSAATPFEMPEVVTAGKQLLAFGIAAEDIQPTLTMLGDVASGIGAPVGDLAYLFGTASASGRLMTADINQFANRGIPIIHALGQAMGVTDDKVRGLAEQGKITSVEMKKAFQYMTAEGSQFGGMMAKQSATLAGMFSTLKDNIGQSLTAIGVQLVKVLNLSGEGGLMTEFLDFTTKMKDGIVSFTETHPMIFKLIVALLGLVAAAGPVIGTIGMLAGLFAEGGMLATGITAISAAFGILTGPIGLAIAAVGLLATAIIKDWGGIGTFLGRVFGTITNVIEGFYDVIVYGESAFSDFSVFFEQLEPLVGTKAANALVTFGNKLYTLREAAVTTFTGLWDIIRYGESPMADFATWFEQLEPLVGTQAANAIVAFGDKLYTLRAAAVATFTGLWDIIRYGESPMADFATWFEQLEPLVGTQAANAIVAFGDKLWTFRATAVAVFTGLWDIIRYGESAMADFDTWFQVLVPLAGGEAAYAITEFGEGVWTIRHYIAEVLTTGNLFNRFFFELPSAVRPTLVAIMQFGATLYTLGQYFAAVVTDGDYLNDWLGRLPEVIQPVVLGIGQFISTLLELPAAIGAAAQAIIHYATTGELLGAVEFGVHGHTAAMADAFATLGADIIDKVNQIQTAISSFMSGADFVALQTGVTTAFESIGTAIHDYFSGDISLGGLAGAVSQGFADIRSALATFFGSSSFQNIASFIALSWASLVTAVQAGFASIDWSPVTSGLSSLVTSISTFVSGIDWATGLATVQEGANSLRDGVLGAITGAINSVDWTGASLTLSGMVNWVADKINSFDWSTISIVDIGQALVGVIMPGLNTAIAGIQWVISSENWAGLVTAVQTALSSIAWGELGTSFLNLVTAIGNAIAGLDYSTITTSFDTLKTTVTTALTAITEGITLPTPEDIATKLNTFRDNLVQGLADAVAGMDLTTALGNIITSITNTIALIDWSGVGTALGSALSFVLSGEGLATLLGASVTAVAPALATAIAGLVWVFSSDNWVNLTNAIVTSITNIDWSTVGEKFGTLKTAITSALGDFADGFSIGFEAPDWVDFIDKLKWPDLTWDGWSAFIDDLVWPTIDWPGFAFFVANLVWPVISWPGFSEFVDKLSWPSISWPGWGSFIDAFPGWPDIGGMISNMIPDIPGFNALGTNNWKGGMTWVGEAGPELVYLPRGSAVDSASESKRRGSDGSGITIGAVYVQDEMDAYTMAYQLDDLRKRRERR